jgi:hypothetical protein
MDVTCVANSSTGVTVAVTTETFSLKMAEAYFDEEQVWKNSPVS